MPTLHERSICFANDERPHNAGGNLAQFQEPVTAIVGWPGRLRERIGKKERCKWGYEMSRLPE